MIYNRAGSRLHWLCSAAEVAKEVEQLYQTRCENDDHEDQSAPDHDREHDQHFLVGIPWLGMVQDILERLTPSDEHAPNGKEDYHVLHYVDEVVRQCHLHGVEADEGVEQDLEAEKYHVAYDVLPDGLVAVPQFAHLLNVDADKDGIDDDLEDVDPRVHLVAFQFIFVGLHFVDSAASASC